MDIDYHIHSADEFILVSEMEEAVLIYMEQLKICWQFDNCFAPVKQIVDVQ